MRSPLNTANGHISKSQTVELISISRRLYGHSFEMCCGNVLWKCVVAEFCSLPLAHGIDKHVPYK